MHKKVTLGLDLQGGLEVVLKAVPPKHKTCDASCMERSISIMRSRIDKLGVAEPEIRKQGKDQIVIQLAGVHDAGKAAQIIGKTAQLQFYDLETDVDGPLQRRRRGIVVATPSLYNLLTPGADGREEGHAHGLLPLQLEEEELVAGPEDTRAKLLDTPRALSRKGAEGLHGPGRTAEDDRGQLSSRRPAARASPTRRPAATVYYLFKFDPNPPDPVPEATGGDLKLSAITADISTSGQGNVVRLGFTGEGREEVPRHHAERGDPRRGRGRRGRADRSDLNTVTQYAQHFAIVLDGELKSTPYIDYKQNPDGIDPTGTGAEISNITSFGEAKDLALVLQTGALPVKFDPDRAHRRLGHARQGLAASEAKIAALIGLLLVAVFLLVLYRFLGVVAVVGLGIYAAFLYAAILLFHVTLTLPGFAGLILTIGVAADANVVVFERIKEEVRSGKSVRAAISAGYAKGFHTIIDANVVTVITALVLFAVATAGVKGFALMLMIGTVISLVTAVGATRAMLGLLAGFRWFENPRFMGAEGQQSGKWLQIDFMKRPLPLVRDLRRDRRDLDRRARGQGAQPRDRLQGRHAGDVHDAEARLASQCAHPGGEFGAEPVVQGRGKAVGAATSTRASSCGCARWAGQTTALSNDIKQRFGQNVTLQIQTVSASFGKQIARSAIIAILFSLLLIILYVAIRFDFKFAAPVIVALLHDIVITVGVYALIGREVSNSTVAAVLTVLGYSIYDTIIIFDRIRENIPLMRRAPFATIANVSLWETIRRSLATTFITLLPIGALLVFGGATLQDFAFALMVGIVSGRVLVDLHRRAAADDLEGARARVRAPQGPGAEQGRTRRPSGPAPADLRAAARVTDGGTLRWSRPSRPPPPARAVARRRAASAGRLGGGEAGAPAAAPKGQASWPSALSSARSPRSSSSPASARSR